MHPDALFYQKTIQQWKYDAIGITPTTFLYANLAMNASLDACTLPNLEKPTNPLIRRTGDGVFRTSAAKKYPMALNKALAMAFMSNINRLPVPMRAEQMLVEPLGAELAQLSSCLDGGRYLPDYQPERL